MPQITVTSKTGYGKRIVGSFLGVIFGIGLFFGSFVVLYMNEGRVDVSKIASTAALVSAEGNTEVAEGSLVYVSGEVITDEQVAGDTYLNAGDYVAVERVVEMYSWVEETDTKTTKNVGGSETTETTYNYVNEWTASPQDASDFYDSSYYNPPKSVENDTNMSSSVHVGVYSVSMDAVTLPAMTPLALSEEMLTLSGDAEFVSNYVFIGSGTLTSPVVGDVRVSYNVLNSGTDVTLFGKLSGASVMNYTDESTGMNLYRMFVGSYDAAIAQMHGEYVTMMWLMRLLGFVMMWGGMMLVLGPISTLLDVLPAFGSVSRFILGAITFVIALVLSLVTIAVSMLFHSLIAVIIAAVLVLVGAFVFLKKKGPGMMKK